MSSHTVLVTGATGQVGRHVVQGLLRAGRRVRAVTRDPARSMLPSDVDVRAGDLGEPESIASALSGVDRLYLFPAGNLTGVCAAATAAGVDYVALLSSASVSHGRSDYSSAHHQEAERTVLDSGLPHTFLRPTAFMGNDLTWAPEVIASGTISTAYPDAATAPVDERDVAAVAVRALLTPNAVSTAIEITGPESLSQRRRIELLAQATQRAIRLLELTPDAARQQMGGYLPPEAVDLILGVLAAAPRKASTRPASSELLERAPYSYLDWAMRHAAAFTPTPRPIPQD
ncbi:NAD(P)H-binding protein [Humibacter antri]